MCSKGALEHWFLRCLGCFPENTIRSVHKLSFQKFLIRSSHHPYQRIPMGNPFYKSQGVPIIIWNVKIIWAHFGYNPWSFDFSSWLDGIINHITYELPLSSPEAPGQICRAGSTSAASHRRPTKGVGGEKGLGRTPFIFNQNPLKGQEHPRAISSFGKALEWSFGCTNQTLQWYGY